LRGLFESGRSEVKVPRPRRKRYRIDTAAWAVNGEFGNMCTISLAAGKDTQIDCSINAQIEGKTYCFGNKEAMAEFMKNPKENLAKAQAYYSTKHPG
jgi:YHS domain-containing protein